MPDDDALRLTLEPPRRQPTAPGRNDDEALVITATVTRRQARQLIALAAALGGPMLAVGAAAADALSAPESHEAED